MNGKHIALFLGIALLGGCANTKTSPERHAYYFVSHKSSFVGGNYTSSVSQNYRLNVPQFSVNCMPAAKRTAPQAEHRRKRLPMRRVSATSLNKMRVPITRSTATPVTHGPPGWRKKTPSCLAMNWPRLILTAITAYNSRAFWEYRRCSDILVILSKRRERCLRSLVY